MNRRYARLESADGERVYGELVGGEAQILTAPPWSGGVPTGRSILGVDSDAMGGARRIAPVSPTKIVCVGRNYRAHASELGNEVPVEPLLFFKPPSSILDPYGAIELPPLEISRRIDHEVELGIILGQRVRRATPAQAVSAIFGCTIAGDITARDLQKKDGQWTRAKGMDTFCPVGPVVVTGLAIDALTVECRVNGQTRQSGSTADMIFPVPQLIAYISQVMTLEPGDLILTGTPSGVGPLESGDSLEMAISGIGVLALRVIAPDAGASQA